MKFTIVLHTRGLFTVVLSLSPGVELFEFQKT